nr:immunoglobulin heavy chain junction region [Mus musculus]
CARSLTTESYWYFDVW